MPDASLSSAALGALLGPLDAGANATTILSHLQYYEQVVSEQQAENLELEARLVHTGGVAWTLTCAAMVYFMQAGFALVESGCCRFNSTQSILMKNLMDSVCGTFAWTFVGGALAFGQSWNGLIGTSGFGEPSANLDYNLYHFQWSFAACTATIVSGGVAERIPMEGYIMFSFWMTALIYPVVAHWAWGGGWLGELGFTDFAGGGVVHMTGGFSALMGTKIIGPRDGRFGADRWKFNPHSVPNIVLGTLILWFGWYGFNPGSTTAMGTQEDAILAAKAAVGTTLGAGGGGLAVYLYTTYVRGQYDLPGICNGVLGGLVGVTAGCAYVHTLPCIFIGAVGGLVSLLIPDALEHVLIDDPVGAFPVHGVCGMWGLFATWLFDSTGSVRLDAQIIGVLAISTWACSTSFVIFRILKYLGYGVCSSRDLKRGQDAKYKNDAYMSSQGVARYKVFLSHHKMTRGSFSRMLQLELGSFVESRARIFLDSDNLVNLDTLMQTVREKTDVLAVITSKEVWWRPWVCGEITQATMAQVPLLMVCPRDQEMVKKGEEDPSLPPVNFEQINEQFPDRYAEFQDDIEHLLQPYGIFYSDIEQAYQQLGSYPQLCMDWQDTAKYATQLTELGHEAELISAQSTGGGLVQKFQDALASCAPSVCQGTGGGDGHGLGTLMLGDTIDVEAVATMRITALALREQGSQVLVSSDCATEDTLDALDRGWKVVVVLSQNVTRNLFFSRLLVHIGQSTLPRTVVPMACDKLGFEFPDDEAFERIILEVAEALQRDGGLGRYLVHDEHMKQVAAPTGKKLEKPDADQITVLIAFYTFLFRLIALPFSNHASWRTIDQQIRSLHDRLNPLDTTDESSIWQGPTQAITANAARKLYRATTAEKGKGGVSDASSGKSDGSSSPVKVADAASPAPVEEKKEEKPETKPEPEEDNDMMRV